MERESADRTLAMRLRYRHQMTGMVIGGIIAVGSLGMTVYLAKVQPWLAGVTGLGGTASIATVIAIFVIRRSPSAADLRILTQQPQFAPVPPQTAAPTTAPQDLAADGTTPAGP
ncbi:hypothetical protein [Kitasatospora sp. NPDC017646]|uniref:hypothetical protein n=1 Tax=Kitasatospora sp. NPDC017646 TaxID=3364024 RepID=UPI0037A65FEE